MKKIISIGLMLLAFVVFFISCEKQSPLADNPTQITNTTILNKAPWGLNRVLYCDPDYYCDPPKVDCFDDIIVEGAAMVAIFEDLNEAITAGPAEIASFFSGDPGGGYPWETLFPDLGNDENIWVKNALSSGEYDLVRASAGGGTAYYAGGRTGYVNMREREFVFAIIP